MMNLLTAPSSGSTWIDASGNGNNGTLYTANTGTLTYTSSNGGGLVAAGSSTSTNGNSTAITTPYALTTPFTIEMWCKPNGARLWATMWGSDAYSSNTGWWALWESSTTLTTGGVPSGVTYAHSYTQSNPNHYVFTLTGSTYTLYINGVAVTVSGSYSAPSGSAGTSPLIFGSRHVNGGTSLGLDSLDGTYYQMRVYNRALSSSEVTQNYSGTRGTIGV
jgi:hypothetical protein